MRANLKKPCNECPWRRTHPAGWLGGYEPEAFVQQVQFDGPPVPCHKTIKPGRDEAHTSICAGSLIFMRNSCKSAQHPGYPADAFDGIERDPEGVFQWPHEFLDHHRDREGWLKRAVADLNSKEPK